MKLKVLSEMEFMSFPQRGGTDGLTLSKSLPPFTIAVSETDVRLIFLWFTKSFHEQKCVLSSYLSGVHSIVILLYQTCSRLEIRLF